MCVALAIQHLETKIFYFNTCQNFLKVDADGEGRIAEPSEEEYDALNDETFGSAINGDWEEVHENLVRLTNDTDVEDDSVNENNANADSRVILHGGAFEYLKEGLHKYNFHENADSDLELNLADMKLDDVDISYEESGNPYGDAFKMNPGVWTLNPLSDNNSSVQLGAEGSLLNRSVEPIPMLINFPTSFGSPIYHNAEFSRQSSGKSLQEVNNVLQPTGGIKISTLEDIERNIIMQQALLKHSGNQGLQLENQMKEANSEDGNKVNINSPKQQQYTQNSIKKGIIQQQQHNNLHQSKSKSINKQ